MKTSKPDQVRDLSRRKNTERGMKAAGALPLREGVTPGEALHPSGTQFPLLHGGSSDDIGSNELHMKKKFIAIDSSKEVIWPK